MGDRPAGLADTVTHLKGVDIFSGPKDETNQSYRMQHIERNWL